MSAPIMSTVWNTHADPQRYHAMACHGKCGVEISVWSFNTVRVNASGASTADNLRPVCDECADGVGDKNLQDWIDTRELIPERTAIMKAFGLLANDNENNTAFAGEPAELRAESICAVLYMAMLDMKPAPTPEQLAALRTVLHDLKIVHRDDFTMFAPYAAMTTPAKPAPTARVTPAAPIKAARVDGVCSATTLAGSRCTKPARFGIYCSIHTRLNK